MCLLPVPVQAGIKACTLADGSIVYQDTACIVTPKANTTSAPLTKAVPLGIDKTWFDKPTIAPNQAECTQTGCDCGEYYREFKNGLAMAVADALYIDGSWHRFDAKMSQMKLTNKNTAKYDDLRTERNEAACNILMSQKTLRMFSKLVLAQLRTQKRFAEDMGWDDPADCENGDLGVCEHTDNIALYNRILSDVVALRKVGRIGEVNSDNSNLEGIDYLNIKLPERPASGQQAEMDSEAKR